MPPQKISKRKTTNKKKPTISRKAATSARNTSSKAKASSSKTSHPAARSTRSSSRLAKTTMAAASGNPVTLAMQNEDEKLCFHEASEAFNKKEISEDLYFRYLLVHFRGFRHSDSQESDWSGDEITNSIKRAATMKKYKAFSSEELDSCQQLFQSCMHGDLEQVKAGLETLESRKKTLLPPLAMIGFIKDHAEISHYCVLEAIELKVELGHVLDLVVQKRPVETLDFLLAHNWKNTQNSPKGWQDFLGAALRPSPNHVAIFEWLLDHGVKIPHDDYRSMAYSPPPQSILKRLIVSKIPIPFRMHNLRVWC